MGPVLEGHETKLAETDRHAFNVAVWKRLLADPQLAALDYRIETDEHGQIIMSPPPAPNHGRKQVRIGHVLMSLAHDGEVISECPVSTSKGVKGADVAWCSEAIWERSKDAPCFVECPEVCVEILSPSNTRSEIEEKTALYFEAGAEEVWICQDDGRLQFFLSADGEPQPGSKRFPDFPEEIG